MKYNAVTVTNVTKSFQASSAGNPAFQTTWTHTVTSAGTVSIVGPDTYVSTPNGGVYPTTIPKLSAVTGTAVNYVLVGSTYLTSTSQTVNVTSGTIIKIGMMGSSDTYTSTYNGIKLSIPESTSTTAYRSSK